MFTSRHWLTAGLMFLGCSVSAPVSAAVFTVNTTVDAVDNDTADGVCLTATGGCTLRAAIQQANASAEADEILLPAGVYNLSLLGAEEDAAASGDLDITGGSEIIINGAGADVVILDGMKEDRILQVHPTAILTVNGVTVRNGMLGQSSAGGGIDNHEGRLTVNDSRISGNIVYGQGGGINNFRGVLEVNRSVLNGNLAMSTGGAIMNQDGDVSINFSTIRDNYLTDSLIPTFGGGIYNSALFNVMEINNSTISGHQVFLDGGGVYHLIGTLRITNTTFSDNQAVRYGGGLFYSSGNSTFGIGSSGNRLVNVTVTGNTAFGIDSSDQTPSAGGGGIFVRGAVPLQLGNSLIAGNATGGDCSNDGQIISLGSNLDGDGSCALAGDATSLTGGVAALDVLADNSGPTLTHALLANSEALDAGNDDLCPATDQRGFERPASACDIGAFEASGVAPLSAISAPAASTAVTPLNTRPEATGTLLTVDAGGSVHGEFRGTDADGDELSFEIVQQAQLGTVGQDAEGSSGFTYAARSDAEGADSFSFRACDGTVCSEPAIVNVSVTNEPVNSDIIIRVASGSGSIAGEKQVTLPDADYDQPLGVIRFDIVNVPTDPDANLNGTVVTIHLPVEAQIAADAVIRKLNINQVWETLGSGPDPLVSTGTINRTTNTITLVLRDNDRFDLNRALGVIEDPVALAVPSQGGSGGSVVEDEPADSPAPAPGSGSSGPTVSASGTGNGTLVGGGMMHPFVLMLLTLAGVVLGRRRR